ncbi:glycosyl transferase [Gracilaria domingensis]|nr:glycosyl transferase [Gracilaria domingensis]
MQKSIPAPCPHHILLFTKYPTPGFAKTRLIPAKGPEGAAQISNELTQRTLTTLRSYQAYDPHAHVIIHYAVSGREITVSKVYEWLKPVKRQEVVSQGSGDLGDRLMTAFEHSFAKNASKVVVVGSDTPDLSTDILSNAFKILDDADVVIGPAEDGGYYLLGMKAMNQGLFTSIPWSTSTVLKETVAAAESTGLVVKRLPTLRDIDTPNDLEFFIS